MASFKDLELIKAQKRRRLLIVTYWVLRSLLMDIVAVILDMDQEPILD